MLKALDPKSHKLPFFLIKNISFLQLHVTFIGAINDE